MFFRCSRLFFVFLVTVIATALLAAQSSSSSPSSSSSKHHASPGARRAKHANTVLDPGTVSAGVYRNKSFELSCKIPAGWVLRTDQLNAREESATEESPERKPGETEENKSAGGRVLLAAFSRPPEATGEEVNSSILIAAESVEAYPGLKDAAQYFGPVGEVAKAQGFKVVEEPYEFSVGTKKLVRGDYQKDVGTRAMRQSTVVLLARGYVVSVTFLGGTEDEVEELIAGLSFGVGRAATH